MPALSASVRALQGQLDPVQHDLATIGDNYPGKNLYQGRFARPVVAYDAEDLALAYLDRSTGQRDDGTEAPFDVFGHEDGRPGRRPRHWGLVLYCRHKARTWLATVIFAPRTLSPKIVSAIRTDEPRWPITSPPNTPGLELPLAKRKSNVAYSSRRFKEA